MRLADCTSVNRRLTTSVDTPCRIKADDSKAIQKLWFETPTLTIGEISNMARIQLHTVSRDQGWCSNPQDGSWSWFEIVVLTPLREDPTQFVVKKGSGSHLNDGELIWISHHNPIASDAARHRPGIVFTGDHEIFTHLQEGDKIGVRICAQFGNWQNFALEGALRIDQWFDPTSFSRLRFALQNSPLHLNVVAMPKELRDIKAFIEIASRKDASSARIKKSTTRLASGAIKQKTKFKIRCSRYLYTLVVDDAEKAQKLQQSLPPGLNIVEVSKATKAKK
ncbi:hypothetical protein M422DRAFT_23700 [Sphaerobolus stellatus SS14]|nr:hypothetical protein M422DRAFT_23700 [Sphaerobolus stellatus SS14]